MFYIVDTIKYVFGGSCLASLNGKTVFIPFSLPFEKLKIEIVEEKKNYSNAKILNIIDPSPYRCAPICKYFYHCGGCNMQMAMFEEQRNLKVLSVKDTFNRFHIKVDFPINIIFDKDVEYRSRFQFHIYKGKLSLLGKKSHNFINIEDCPIACKEIRDYITRDVFFNNIKNGLKIKTFGHNGNVYTSLKDKICNVNILGKNISFSPKAFFQSNIGMLKKLISLLDKNIESCNRMLDFYSGVGTFSLFLAHKAKEIHLVEWNKCSMESSRLNLLNAVKKNPLLKCFFHSISSEDWSKKKEANLTYDVAIVDPPREGIDKGSLMWFCKKNVKKIFYVSCDPVTFSRDTFVLINEAGYKLESYYLLDFYPQTHHIESLGIFNL